MMQFRLPPVVQSAARKIVKLGNDIAWSTAVTFTPRMREKKAIGLFCDDLKDVGEEVVKPHGSALAWQKPYIRIEIVRDLPHWFTPMLRKNFGYIATTDIGFSLLDAEGQQQKTGSVTVVNACTHHILTSNLVSGGKEYRMRKPMPYGLDFYMQNPAKRAVVKKHLAHAMEYVLFEQDLIAPMLPDFIKAMMEAMDEAGLGPRSRVSKTNDHDPK